ncbi:MAG: 4Fe-4S dicluster domain-containing protein [Candidatus Micrarchaeota archaeon]
MQNYSLSKDKLREYLLFLMREYDVIAPIKLNGAVVFKLLAPDDEVELSKNADYSPKSFFFPPREQIVSFKGNEVQMPAPLSRKRVLFGIRPCDLNALLTTDLFFKNPPQDHAYADRRANTFILALECTSPTQNCFCESMGAGKAEKYDMLFQDSGDHFVVKLGTDSAKQLITQQLQPTEENPTLTSPSCKKSIKSLNIKQSKKIDKIFDKFAEPCLNCGSCTAVCPTCTCFDVEDEVDLTLKGGERRRTWDSCHFKSFTTVSGGHCFRESRGARLKQRVLHKLLYFNERFGKQMCVGCGRCITACLVGIDITKIANKITGD